MSEESKGQGNLFSEVYLQVEKGPPASDSPNFRERLYAYVAHELGEMDYSLCKALHRELGQRFPFSHRSTEALQEFFSGAAIEVVLDAVTIIFREFEPICRARAVGDYTSHDWRPAANLEMSKWRNFVNKVFQKEHIGYFVDELGGVHPLVDEEFQRSKQATIAGLSHPDLEHVRDLYESAFEQLDQHPPGTREAVANVYSSVEALFKTLTNSNPKSNLNAQAARQKLVPGIEQKYGSDPVAVAAAKEQLESYLKWAQAAHNYRHGQQRAPINPPIEIAVGLISMGSSFIRWLLSLYD